MRDSTRWMASGLALAELGFAIAVAGAAGAAAYCARTNGRAAPTPGTRSRARAADGAANTARPMTAAVVTARVATARDVKVIRKVLMWSRGWEEAGSAEGRAAAPSRRRRWSRLLPDRPAEIDLLPVGEGDGTADQRAFERRAHHEPAERADTGADAAAAQGAVARGVAAGGEREGR